MEEEAEKKKLPIKKDRYSLCRPHCIVDSQPVNYVRVYSSGEGPILYTYSRPLFCPFVQAKPLRMPLRNGCLCDSPQARSLCHQSEAGPLF